MSVIATQNLTKYYGKHVGIKNVTLNIDAGEIFGFAGPNGAGKSTLIKTLLNFLYPSSGKAEILGLDIASQSAEIKRFTGYVPADVRYSGYLSAEELLRYTLAFHGIEDKKYMFELAETFKLDLKKQIRKLSTGNKKKVAILAAMIHSPKLMIMDEPTGGLDPLMKNIFFDIIQKKKQGGMCVFLSGHNLNEIQEYCDRVALIREGEIIDIKDIHQAAIGERIKKVVLRCKDIPLGLLKSLGGESLKISGENIIFDYSGDISQLLRIISQYKIKDISISEPNLEHLFMQYYKR